MNSPENYSEFYLDSVKRNTEFQINNKTWSGGSTLAYAEEIREYVKKHNAKSLLDYGCGKALHYEDNSLVSFEGGQTFDKFLGIDSVYKYDPCVEEFSVLPPLTEKFDAVIMIQALGLIPDQDIPWVVNLLMQYTKGFCFIGNKDPAKGIKPKKQALTNFPGFSVSRDRIWYENQFKNWKGSELIFSWK